MIHSDQGLGEPNLYEASLELHGVSNITVSYSKKIGFRTAVLDLSPYDDREGNHWGFQINGQPFNTKGKTHPFTESSSIRQFQS